MKYKTALGMLGGRKTVIFEFLGTGMISVMPVPLLSVHPQDVANKVIFDMYLFLSYQVVFLVVHKELYLFQAQSVSVIWNIFSQR